MIHVFIGTKAQLIKMGPVMKELENRNVTYNFIISGQHSETMDMLIENFGLKQPDVRLYDGPDITKIPQMLVWGVKIIIKAIKQRQKILKGDRKGIILNHGDTFSALIGSLLAKCAGLKNAHIESGLRSYNLLHPFPEEITRLIIFWLTDYYFCPNQLAVDNVKRYRGVKINTQNNTLYDSLKLAQYNDEIKNLDKPNEKFAIATLHRYENVFNKKSLLNIVNMVEEFAKAIKVLFILHPPTKKNLEKYDLLARLRDNPNIELRPRYDYFDFISLVNKAEFLISDGGSNQEESSYLGKPCILLRKATERPEGLGENVVLSNYKLETIRHFINNYSLYRQELVINHESPSKIIVDALLEGRFA